MRNIVIPTDFSIPALNALNYAINLANHFGSTIHLIHIYEVRSRVGMLRSIRGFMQEDAEQQLSQQVKAVKKQLFPRSSLKALALEGRTVERINAYAKGVNADIIVMGTQGTSALKEIFIGSNTAGVIQKSEVSVMVIPNDYTYQPFHKIALALDDQIVTTPEILQTLISITKAYKAEIAILHVNPPAEVSATIDKGVDFFLEETEHHFHTIHDESVHHGLHHFVKEQGVGLLCMIRRERSFIGKIFHNSATRRAVFDSSVPLLILYN